MKNAINKITFVSIRSECRVIYCNTKFNQNDDLFIMQPTEQLINLKIWILIAAQILMSNRNLLKYNWMGLVIQNIEKLTFQHHHEWRDFFLSAIVFLFLNHFYMWGVYLYELRQQRASVKNVPLKIMPA